MKDIFQICRIQFLSLPHDSLCTEYQLYNPYTLLALVLMILPYLKISIDQSYPEEILGKLDTRNVLNVTIPRNTCDEADGHSLECDKVYDLYEYLPDRLDNLHEKHFLRTANIKQRI